MTRKKRRAVVIVLSLAVISVATGFTLWGLQQQVTFFKSPGDIVKTIPDPAIRFRLGGLVAQGSFRKEADATLAFSVTDGAATVPVTYRGILPDLFREGQGIVAEGKLNTSGVFVADSVLAKHDENYMPREVADALKKNGHWQGDNAPKAGGRSPGT